MKATKPTEPIPISRSRSETSSYCKKLRKTQKHHDKNNKEEESKEQKKKPEIATTFRYDRIELELNEAKLMVEQHEALEKFRSSPYLNFKQSKALTGSRYFSLLFLPTFRHASSLTYHLHIIMLYAI